jgi:GTP-binding protein
MADITKDGERKTIIKGGRGGRGNQHFATPTRQAPRYAERGQLSKEYDVILELKLIADVGIIGFPNVGKSTLLSMVTNANPKIANYHFTTLAPNLGVVEHRKGANFVMADIPGLVEGASEGVGLGHEFLRHVERTKVLIHVVDAAAIEGKDPINDIKKINSELEAYNPELLKRPQIIAANKIDIPEAAANVKRLKEYFEPKGYKVFPISAATNKGLDELIEATAEILKNYPDDIVFEEDFEEYDEPEIDSAPFEIEVVDNNYYIVTGVGVEKMIGYTNIDTEKGFAFFQKYLREKGIIAALEEKGIKEGDTVKIYDLEFEYFK